MKASEFLRKEEVVDNREYEKRAFKKLDKMFIDKKRVRDAIERRFPKDYEMIKEKLLKELGMEE